MGYPTLYSRPDSAVVATLAVRFPTALRPDSAATLGPRGAFPDVELRQAHIPELLGLMFAPGMVST